MFSLNRGFISTLGKMQPGVEGQHWHHLVILKLGLGWWTIAPCRGGNQQTFRHCVSGNRKSVGTVIHPGWEGNLGGGISRHSSRSRLVDSLDA